MTAFITPPSPVLHIIYSHLPVKDRAARQPLQPPHPKNHLIKSAKTIIALPSRKRGRV